MRGEWSLIILALTLDLLSLGIALYVLRRVWRNHAVIEQLEASAAIALEASRWASERTSFALYYRERAGAAETREATLRDHLAFIADWAHECDPDNMVFAGGALAAEERVLRRCEFGKIEQRCRAALAENGREITDEEHVALGHYFCNDPDGGHWDSKSAEAE